MNNTKISFTRTKAVFFFGLLVVLGIAMLYVFKTFLYPIFWAAVIAILFHPLYKWGCRVFHYQWISITFTLLSVVIILLLPLAIITGLVVKESVDIYKSISVEQIRTVVKETTEWLETTPLAPYVDDVREQWPEYLSNSAQKISDKVFGGISAVTQNSLRFIFMLFVMFYTLYYFLKDGRRMLSRLMHLSPLGDDYETLLYERFTSTTRATLKGTLIVGGIQGIFSGLLFFITGIEGAFVWAVIMTVIAIIPAIGTPIVLVPAGIIMLALGNVWQGIVILAGAGVVSVIDNLLRPPLVGRDIQMHPLIVFFTTLGGIWVFGVSGFVIGPVLAALFLAVVSMYDHYYKRELEHN